MLGYRILTRRKLASYNKKNVEYTFQKSRSIPRFQLVFAGCFTDQNIELRNRVNNDIIYDVTWKKGLEELKSTFW